MTTFGEECEAWHGVSHAAQSGQGEDPKGACLMVERRRNGSGRRAGIDRRKCPGRRRTDRGEPPQAKSAGRAAPGQTRMFDTGVTRIERRRGDRRAGADRRGSTDRRAPAAAQAIAPAKAARRTRLVPCAPGSNWLNADQAAEYLGVSRRGLYRLVTEEAIRGYRRSGRARGFLLFDKSELDAFIKRRGAA